MLRMFVILLLPALMTSMYGQSSTATQTLQLSVLPVAALSVSGDPAALTVLASDAGDPLLIAEDRSTSYRLSSNRTALKITASMNAPLPDGMRLLTRFASSRGTTLGTVDLGDAAAPATVVTNIGKGTEIDEEIAYTLIVDSQKIAPSSQQRTIVITLTE